jgi:hypothetical protein
MADIFSLISIGIYFVAGIICFVMAFKSMLAKKFLPFQEEASGTKWEKLKEPLRHTMLTMLRISGLGFLIVGLCLTVFPPVNYFVYDGFIRLAVPALSSMFCLGLFWFNYDLYKKTGASTPWKNSLIAMFVIMAGMAISFL